MSAWQQESEKNSSFLITFRTYTLSCTIAVSYKEKRKKKKLLIHWRSSPIVFKIVCVNGLNQSLPNKDTSYVPETIS